MIYPAKNDQQKAKRSNLRSLCLMPIFDSLPISAVNFIYTGLTDMNDTNSSKNQTDITTTKYKFEQESDFFNYSNNHIG